MSDETPVAPATNPDALLIPTSWAVGSTTESAADAICTYAESILAGADRANGKTAVVRSPIDGSGLYFVTMNPRDTRFHEYGHPRQLKPRYRWEDKGDGSSWGWLADDATPTPTGDEPTKPNPIARMMADKAREAARA